MKLTDKGVLAFLLNAKNTGLSASALTSFVKGTKNNPLSLDGGLSAKLKNVMDGVTAVQLNGLVQGQTLSLIASAIKELKSVGTIADATKAAIVTLPQTKILQSSEVYQYLATGSTSEGLQALASEGSKKAADKAAKDARQANLDSVPKPSVVTPSVVTPSVVTPSVVTPSVVTPSVVTPSVVSEPVFDYVGYCQQVKSDLDSVQQELADNQQFWESDVLPIFEACASLSVKPEYDGLSMVKACALTLTNDELDAAISALIAVRKGRETHVWNAA